MESKAVWLIDGEDEKLMMKDTKLHIDKRKIKIWILVFHWSFLINAFPSQIVLLMSKTIWKKVIVFANISRIWDYT